MDAKIIPMSENYRNELIAYMHKIYPSFSEDYIQFDVNEAIGTDKNGTKSIIVINDNNKIVGCHLNFITKAWINGEEKVVVWGHNTYLDEKYRKTTGLDFILQINAIKDGFGYGLSDVNSKIQHLFKTNVFISGLQLYRIYQWSIIVGVFYKIIKKKITIPDKLPTYIKGNDTYSHCKSVKDISIPKDGYWNKSVCNVDFIRDENFLNRRFFKNKVNKYYVYTNSKRNCYFVVRPKMHNGITALQIVDCRYTPYEFQTAMGIYKAIEKLCTKIRAGMILFTTSDRFFKTIYENRKTCKSWPITFVCGKNNTSDNTYIIVNSADSDGEFH